LIKGSSHGDITVTIAIEIARLDTHTPPSATRAGDLRSADEAVTTILLMSDAAVLETLEYSKRALFSRRFTVQLLARNSYGKL